MDTCGQRPFDARGLGITMLELHVQRRPHDFLCFVPRVMANVTRIINERDWKPSEIKFGVAYNLRTRCQAGSMPVSQALLEGIPVSCSL